MRDNPADKVYTPSIIVEDVLKYYGHLIQSDQTLMEPFRGEGAFYKELKNLSDNPVEWCEIDDGVDFFQYEGKVDWIITNPPYSIFKHVLPKSIETAINIIFLMPINKVVGSMPRMMDIKKAGYGIKEVYYLGSGRQLKFPFGFPVAAIYIQKGWTEGWYKETYHERCYNTARK